MLVLAKTEELFQVLREEVPRCKGWTAARGNWNHAYSYHVFCSFCSTLLCHCSSVLSRSHTVDTDTEIKVDCWKPRPDKCFPLKTTTPGVGQNIATYALLAATKFFLVLISTFPLHGWLGIKHQVNQLLPAPFTFIFLSRNPLFFIAFVLANAVSSVGPWNKTGHKRFKQVPVMSAYDI